MAELVYIVFNQEGGVALVTKNKIKADDRKAQLTIDAQMQGYTIIKVKIEEHPILN